MCDTPAEPAVVFSVASWAWYSAATLKAYKTPVKVGLGPIRLMGFLSRRLSIQGIWETWFWVSLSAIVGFEGYVLVRSRLDRQLSR